MYPFGAKGDPDDGQEYLRCLEKRCFPALDPLCLHIQYHTTKFRCQVGAASLATIATLMHRLKPPELRMTWGVCGRGTASLVHYWYHPDSYDRCLSAEVAPEVVEPDKRIKGKADALWDGTLSLSALRQQRYLVGHHHGMHAHCPAREAEGAAETELAVSLQVHGRSISDGCWTLRSSTSG